MRTKEGFVLRSIRSHYLLVGEGFSQVYLNKVFEQNESAAFLWKAIEGKEFTTEQLAALLQDEYDVSPEMAQKDARNIADQWLAQGLIEP